MTEQENNIPVFPDISALGVLSDSHGNAKITAEAVKRLVIAGAEIILHLGDIETTDVLDALLIKNDLPVYLVFGNVDWPVEPLQRYAELLGIRVEHPCGTMIVGGKRIVYHHGHIPRYEREARQAGVDYFLHGHTHVRRDEVVDGMRIINPGALTRATEPAAATIRPGTGDVRFLTIPRN